VLAPAAVDTVVAERDAVLSALGVPAGKEPITTYRRVLMPRLRALEQTACPGRSWIHTRT